MITTSHKKYGLHGNDYKDELLERLNGKNKEEFKAELKNDRTWETFTTKKPGKACQ